MITEDLAAAKLVGVSPPIALGEATKSRLESKSFKRTSFGLEDWQRNLGGFVLFRAKFSRELFLIPARMEQFYMKFLRNLCKIPAFETWHNFNMLTALTDLGWNPLAGKYLLQRFQEILCNYPPNLKPSPVLKPGKVSTLQLPLGQHISYMKIFLKRFK